MTRRPVFWIVFVALGLAGAVTALRLFTVALPNVSLEIEMDREAAIAEALSLADRYGWGPGAARSAASFGQVDSEVQTYVELEGGGRDAFQELMDVGAYQPYQWRVRRFAEGEVEEVEVRFTPGGAAYGFELRLAEDDPGSDNLDEDGARAVGEREAVAWSVDLTRHDLIESSEEAQPGGRVDHTFVYERGDVTLADARFRLRLVVSGDRLSELTRFVFVPEAFSQRYRNMRSTNDAIALVAQSFLILVCVLLGAGVGTALLLRQRWIEWRMALAWGSLTAVLFGLNTINALPLSWMIYDTAVSAGTFILQNVAAAGAIAILGAPILAFFFLAGESLGRRAFPEHLQQWRFWSPEVAASTPALGLTVAAYLLVGIQVGYVVLFYLGTSRLEGWWSPADALVQPDLLATYVPWLQAVSLSLFASFWEESIFRAVPIACAALIGARYGRRSLWIWGAVLVQAVVFAAGHANYPQQPAYARVVELSLPALAWGAVYVYYGLVPTILAHFLYDLALISTVLFASEALVDQGVVVVIAAVPLAIVLWARRGGRAADAPPEWAYNRAWSPRERVESEAEEATSGVELEGAAEPAAPAVAADAASRLSIPRTVVPLAGALGFGLWIGALTLDDSPDRLEVSRGDAVAAAHGALQRLGFDVDGWTAAASTGDGRSQAHVYVFEEAGPESFDALVGTFLAPPQWVVRFVEWGAEPAERVEEFVVNVEADGSIRRVVHTLPEARPGAALDEDSARVLARSALPPRTWEEVGAQETTHESRTDWQFTFRDPSVLSDLAGEARAAVSVVGNEVTNVRRFVEVPEEWEREQRERTSRQALVSTGLDFVLMLMFGAAAVVAIVVWSRHELETGPLWKAALLTFVALSLSLANAWPATTSTFSTAQPYGFQAGGAAIGFVLLSILGAAAIGLVVALAHSWADRAGRLPPPAFVGVSLGLLLAGLRDIVMGLSGAMPEMPDYSGAAAFVPALAAPFDRLVPFLFVTAAVSVLAVAHRRFRGHAVFASVTRFGLLALGFAIVPEALQDSVVAWVAAGLLGAAVIWGLVYVVGALPALAPTVFATMAVLEVLEAVLERAYPGSLVGSLLAIVLLCGLAWNWSRELGRTAVA